jgi:ABC-type nickel/cobalt efflux system permease component RcnA
VALQQVLSVARLLAVAELRAHWVPRGMLLAAAAPATQAALAVLVLMVESPLRTPNNMAAAESTVFALLKATWPVLVVAGGGLMAWGSLRSDVQHIKTQQDQQINDHDAIVRIDERQKRMETDVQDMKQDIKDIAEAVKN